MWGGALPRYILQSPPWKTSCIKLSTSVLMHSLREFIAFRSLNNDRVNPKSSGRFKQSSSCKAVHPNTFKKARVFISAPNGRDLSQTRWKKKNLFCGE